MGLLKLPQGTVSGLLLRNQLSGSPLDQPPGE